MMIVNEARCDKAERVRLILPRLGEVVPKATEGEDGGKPSTTFLPSPSVRLKSDTSPWRGRIFGAALYRDVANA